MSGFATQLPAGIAGGTLPAFGTQVSFWVTDPGYLDRVGGVLRDWLEEVDQACSRFREDSELSRANRGAGRPVEVSPVLLEAVEAALATADLTGGLCDPTVGRALLAAGYDRSFTELPAQRDVARGKPRPAGRWREVIIDRHAGSLTVPEGVSLDLGGSAKGWTVDTALDLVLLNLVAEADSVGVCLSAGGDIAVAGAPPGGGWPVRVAENLDSPPADDDWIVHLSSGAIATSGALRRRWSMADGPAHHIIDPRSGAPGESCWRLVTVIANQCLVADTSATAVWLLGAEGPAWMNALGLQGRLVREDGSSLIVGLPDLGDA